MQIDDVIAEFGEMVGISSLTVNEHGVVHLTIENIGDLFIDDRVINGNHFVFVYLVRVYESVSGRLYGQALTLCDYRHKYPFIINPVLHDEQALGFSIKFSQEDFNIQILKQATEVLKDLQDQLESIGV